MRDFGTASPLEIIWVAILLYGMYVSVVNLREAHKDDAARIAKGKNGPLLIVTRQGIRNERLTLLVMAMFTAIGVVALLLPGRSAPLHGHIERTVALLAPVVTPFAAIAAIASLVYGSRCNRRDRHLIDQWHERYPIPHTPTPDSPE